MGVNCGYDGLYVYERGDATWQLALYRGRSCVCRVDDGHTTLFLSEELGMPSGLHFHHLKLDAVNPSVSCSSFCFPEIAVALNEIHNNPQVGDRCRFQYRQLWTKSIDGTLVPIDVYGENLDSTPILVFAYGGFGRSLTAFYSNGLFANWISKGFSVAIVHARGGHEFGRKWLLNGSRRNRNNSREDVVAALETLHSNLNLTPEMVMLHGMSHGALLVALSGINRPDLARNYACKVPISDTRMIQNSPFSEAWIEFYVDPMSEEWDQHMKQEDPIHCSTRGGVLEGTNWFISSYRGDLVTDPVHAVKLGQRVLSLGGSLVFRGYSGEGGHHGAFDEATRRLHESEFWSWANAIVEPSATKGSINA